MRSVAFLCLIFGAAALKTEKRAGLLSADAQDMDLAERPVAKVVKLLQDMTAQLNKEAEDDAEAYESMACWCETGDKQKAKEIADGTQKVSDLTASIEELTAKGAQLRTDIETLETSVAEQTAALTQATAIRDKERAEFVAEEKDMTVSITSLKGAVQTLSKTHSELQTGSVLQLLRSHADKHKHIVPRRIFNLIQVKQSTPASGEIYGILKQMKESFETNLKGSQEEEVTAEKEYASLKTAKTKEIAAANGQITDKQKQLGDTDQANAQAQTDKKDTEEALEADTAFLADLKDKCAVADSEYAARVKVRTEEIAAVSDTVNILTSEEANDAFTKSMTFVQKAMKRSGVVTKAMDVLQKAGQKLHSPKLATLAMSLKLDAFSKVKENIDQMVVELKEESADEVADRDQCIKDLNINTKQAAAKADAKADLDAKIASLESNIADLTSELKALTDSTFETQVQMKKATANRASENKDFQETITDQRATQAILEKAVNRLKQFYDKKAAFVQEGAPGEALAPPPAQKTYAKQNGGGAVAMIMEVMQESKDLELQAIQDETTAQAAYEGFVKDSNKLITANTNSVANKSEAKAKADSELAIAKGDLKTTIADILALDDMAKSLHDQCDFLLDHFTERQSKRSQEIDALNQAKAIFSGMK